MDQELPRHEKIRFRRHEITNLGALPSACMVPPLGQAAIGRGFRILARTAFAAIMLAVVLALAVYAIGASGIGSERLRATAEKAIEDLAGIDVNMTLGPARITLDGSSFLALEVGDVSLKTADGKPMVDAASMRFGVRFLPLLSGEVHLTSARIADAHISLGAMPAGGGDWAAHLRNADGLLDPDKVSAALFDAVREALGAVRRDSLREIGLTDVEFALPAGAGVQTVHVASATVSQTGPGKMDVAAEVAVDGRALALKAAAVRDPATSRISSLSADVTMAAPASRADAKMLSGGELGELALHLTGSEGGDDADSRLAASLSLADSAFDLGKHGVVAGDLSVDASLTSGTNKISLDRLLVKTGRSTYNFAGSIGPKPRDAATGGEEPSYRYDFTSDGSTLAPEDSPEPALAFLARVAGEYRTESRKLVADTIALRSGPTGEVRGDAAVAFVAGEAPGVSLDLSVHDMPVSHVKQLWPWFSAHGARTWVLQN
ncbi:MAG: AsmA family protein, partial [Mesorhizobium sp.]